MLARVYITLKPGVLDPEGETIGASLRRLGFEQIEGVRVGKYLEIETGADDETRMRQRVEEMCDALLANPVLENYRIEIAE